MQSEANENNTLTEENLLSWKVKELKQWLVDHKKKKSGNKQQLIHRIIRSLQFDDSSDSEWESDCSDTGFCDLPSIESCKTGWEVLTTDMCPPTRQEDIENYFIYNKNPVTGKTQGCHRQLKKAKKFAKEGYLYDIEYNGLDNSPYCYVKAKCKPSMKEIVLVDGGKMSRYYSLHAVFIKKTGKIEGGHCNCKAGLTGLCSHTGGLLMTVVSVKNACTSRICEWLKPQTKQPQKSQRWREIQISSAEAAVKPYPDIYQAGPCKDPDTFYQDIMAGLGDVNGNCCLFQTMNPNITDLREIKSKYQPLFMYCDWIDLNSSVCQSEFRTFMMDICLTESEIVKVVNSTKGQSCNPVWKEVRTNIITASNFGPVCKKKEETEPDNLIAKLCGYKENVDTKPMKYGRKKEGQARREYARSHLKTCGIVTVETTGLIISKEFPFLGASVDGLVKCAKCGDGVVEIKCPYVGRNVTPKEWSVMKSSFVNQDLKLKDHHNYMYQVMGQMKILKVQWCDFVIWTKKGIHVERIHYSEDFWKNHMLSELKMFYNTYFLAERFSNRVKRGKKLFS